MQIFKLTIKNFRGIKSTTIILPKHAVLIGDNNTGKTTILEAIDLVLGPDRLRRIPPIDEHDFFEGKYIAAPMEDAGGDESDTEVAEGQDPENIEELVLDEASDEPPQIEIEGHNRRLNRGTEGAIWGFHRIFG